MKFDLDRLFQNFNYEVLMEFYEVCKDPKERDLLKQIYDNDCKISVLEDFISGKSSDKPIKDPRYGTIHEPEMKKYFVNALKSYGVEMRHGLWDLHAKSSPEDFEEKESRIYECSIKKLGEI